MFLRTIEIKNGLETRENTNLGNKKYTVEYRADPIIKFDGKNHFDEILESHFKNESLNDSLVEGFVTSGEGDRYPFFKNQTVYIVSDEGKTIERVYGMLEKR